MSQIFHRSANAFARTSIFGAVFFIAFLGWVGYELDLSHWNTRAKVPQEQLVPFSHKHHVGGEGFDCRYCHTSVENSSFAGIPPTQICMNCHSQIWRTSPMLEPVRASYRTNDSLHWTRVHDLPDYVYFNHSIHIAKGVGCSSCHGEVDRMPLSYKATSLTMQFCLDCHRNPGPNLRPKSQIYNTQWQRTAETPSAQALLAEYHVGGRTLTDCSICHR